MANPSLHDLRSLTYLSLRSFHFQSTRITRQNLSQSARISLFSCRSCKSSSNKNDRGNRDSNTHGCSTDKQRNLVGPCSFFFVLFCSASFLFLVAIDRVKSMIVCCSVLCGSSATSESLFQLLPLPVAQPDCRFVAPISFRANASFSRYMSLHETNHLVSTTRVD